jgi:TRAP-type C4-dicarboxylate transport system permease small subunit
MDRIWKVVGFLSRALKRGGAVCLVGMTALTCIDVVGRFFKYPVFGSVELVTFMGVLAVAAALPFTHETNGHIGVELLMRRLSNRTRAIVDACTGTMGFLLFGVVAWRMVAFAIDLRQAGEVSMNLQLPEYIIVFAVAAAFTILSVVILKGVIDAFGRMRNK